MTDNTNNKLNKIADDLPEVPRTESGEIDIEKISIGKDEKNNYIVPDDIILKYYKELPNGTVSESRTYTAYNKGLLKALTDEIRRKGAQALNAELAQRRSYKELVGRINCLKVPDVIREISEGRGIPIPEGMTIQEAQVYANSIEAIVGSNKTKAAEFCRDTAGEKPTTEIAATIETTPEDIELVKRVASRCDNDIS